MFKINPYRPGAGLMPGYIAGREKDITNIEQIFDALIMNIPVQSVIFSGLRGVGKTVLINKLESIAEEKKIFCKHIEIEERNDFISQIAECSQAFLRKVSTIEKFKHLIQKPLDAIKSLIISFNPNDNTFSVSMQEKAVNAGKGNKKVFSYKYGRELTAELEAADWKLEYIALQAGSQISKGLKDSYSLNECVTLVAGKGTIDHTPLTGAKVGVELPNVPDFLGGLFIEAQGELRLYISAIFRYFHGDMQEYVGLFRVFASFTAYDDTSVYGGTAILNHGPKRVDISVCLFVGQSPGLKVGY